MPTQPFIKFIYKRQPIEGKSKILDVDGCWRGLEFSLPMLNNMHEGFYGNDERTRQWAYSNGVFQSRCEPLTVWLEFGAYAPLLYKAWSIGENIDRIEFYWTNYDSKSGKEEVYLTHKLYPAKIISMTFVMPDVKDRRYERYGHNIRLQFLYRFTEVTCVKGYHHHKMEWYNYLSLGQGENDRERYYLEQEMKGWVLDEQPTREQRLAGIDIHSLSWEHADEKRKDDKEAAIGDAIRLSADVDGGREGNTVTFELYYQPEKESGREFDRVSGKLSGGTAIAGWTVNFDKIKDKSFLDKPYKVYFTPCYEGKYGGNRDIPVVPAKIACDFVEIPDVLFNFDSPLPCLDAEGNLIAALVAAFRFAKDNPDKDVVIFGHTDTKGSTDYNLDLSRWRGEALKALVEGDNDAWANLSAQATTTDEQAFLSALTVRHGWSCDPGAIDCKDGPKTKAAREAFQRQYNEKYGGSLKVDGIFGEKSWGAMFEVVRGLIFDEYKAATNEETLPKLTFVYGGKGVYACGEAFPIEGLDGADAKNRRVEIVFFDKGACPKLADHTQKSEPVTKQENPVYDPKKTERRKIPVATVGSEAGGIMVELHEYTSLKGAVEANGGKLGSIITGLRKYHTVAVTGSKTSLVNDKWVYAFKKEGDSVSLSYECRATAQSGKPSFSYVSWAEADRDANMKSYPRKDGKTASSFTLSGNTEYYVLLSQIQLPVSRIEWYAQNPQRLAERSLFVPADALKPGGVCAPRLFQTEYIATAYEFANEYHEAAQEHEEWMRDETKAKRRYLACLVSAVAQNKPRLKGWLDYVAVERERGNYEREEEIRRRDVESAKTRLKEWKLSSGFQHTREDYNGYKEIEEAILEHETALTSVDEIEYLVAEIENKGSWYNALVGNEPRFTFFRKLETLAANEHFAEYFKKYIVGMYLANFGPTKWKGKTTIEWMVQTQEKFLNHIHEIIDRGKITFPDLVQNRGKWFFVQIDKEAKLPFIDYEFKSTGRISGRTSLDTMKYREAKRKWNTAVDKALPALQTVLVAIETVNLVNTTATFYKQSESLYDWAFNGINVTGSFADLASSLEYLGKKRVGEWRANRGAAPDKATVFASKVFAGINLAGAVCDYIGALKDTAEASSKGYNRTAAGYSVIALASVASGAAAASTLSGAAVFGLAAGPLGVIGIGLFIAGAGIVWYFSDEELQIWAESSIWGKKPAGIAALDDHIRKLHEIICVFDTSCYLYAKKTRTYLPARDLPADYDYWFTVRIWPGYVNEQKSKYRVALKIFREGGLLGKDTPVFDRTLVLPDNQTQREPYEATRPLQMLLRRFSGKELGLPDNFYEAEYRYEITATLDLDGDGKADFPAGGKTIKGAVKTTGKDL